MTHCPSDHEKHKSCSCVQAATCTQSLDDMEFERGIWSAAQSGDIERLIKLARRGVDAVDRGGYTALHYAARSGHVDICRQLMLMGAAVNVTTRAGRATPLHRAATAGHAGVVKLLMDAGADVSMQDSDGQTPVHRAAALGHVLILQHLLKYNQGPLKVTDNRGLLPLHLALRSTKANNRDLIKLLQV